MELGSYFTIRSALNGFYLTIKDGDVQISTEVVTQPKSSNCQIWYADPIRCRIRAKSNPKYVLDLNTGNVNPT